jgi:hypothetical protein
VSGDVVGVFIPPDHVSARAPVYLLLSMRRFSMETLPAEFFAAGISCFDCRVPSTCIDVYLWPVSVRTISLRSGCFLTVVPDISALLRIDRDTCELQQGSKTCKGRNLMTVETFCGSHRPSPIALLVLPHKSLDSSSCLLLLADVANLRWTCTSTYLQGIF